MEEVSLYVLFGQRKGSHPGEYAEQIRKIMSPNHMVTGRVDLVTTNEVVK